MVRPGLGASGGKPEESYGFGNGDCRQVNRLVDTQTVFVMTIFEALEQGSQKSV